ncbi:glycoside hydrolase family 2 TIM barrel-domain containing protein [Zobellia roscoffensis]|uniref:glycoside hydrolase family 2 TIM barrel-domain containing protein n=1 Tax=Zobellia roscoffensis TaxID=2779508 RepID=UPI00188A99AB|nr:glycoside hydrolase family 2 TIM barrel-domain containing protein [Zobellia roscoffensis]
MKKYLLFFALIGSVLTSCTNDKRAKTELTQVSTDFNHDWQFQLVDTTGNSANWKNVRLPHDWSVEASFDSINGEGATGYLPGGTGLYRKKFPLKLQENENAYILFDGVYNNSEVVLNGEKVGAHPYGYSPFYFNISPYLNSEKDSNLIEVKVDRTRYADSRWYTGSGIYRDVKLLVKNKLHIPVWGVFITTPKIDENRAEVSVAIDIQNDFSENKNAEIQIDIYDREGKKVNEQISAFSIVGNMKTSHQQSVSIENANLWSVENPYLYKAITSIVQDGKIIDQQERTFGVQSIRFDADEGFFLNGENMKIKGVCLHHDGGLVGAAVPDDVWRRRLAKLKEAGCNAIRISHNPGSQAFLDLCDEMGFLVQDEFFDEWDNPKDKRKNMNEQSVDYITRGYTEHFQEWAEKDLKNTVLAHRNHPSIIQWSIGNEIEWTYPRNADATGFFNNMGWQGNYFFSEPPFSVEQINEKLNTLPKGKYDIGETAHKLAKWTKELDTTRYVTANCILPSASHLSGYADALDVVGYSYRRVIYDYGHKNYPNKVIMGTENLPQWHEWKAVMERPFISGLFLWTGIDYMGESNGGWPKKGTQSGLLNQAGFEKTSYHMMKTLWNDAPHLHITTQSLEKSIYKLNGAGEPVEKKENGWEKALWFWHESNEYWNYDVNEPTVVEVYSNCEEVELFLNDASLGKKKLVDFNDHIYKWSVPFTEGELRAEGYIGGKKVDAIAQIKTAKEPYAVQLSVDKTELGANAYDVAHIVAQIVDEDGNPVRHINSEISFSISGDVKLLGVDNGSARNVQDFQSNKIVTDQGRALLIVQSNAQADKVTISAASEGLKTGEVTLKIIPADK